MNKHFFTWLLVLTLISLSGIFTVQFFWFENPLQMNNELFSRIVNESLNRAILQYEINQDVRTIDQGIKGDTLTQDFKFHIQQKSNNNPHVASGNIIKSSTPSTGDSSVSKKQSLQEQIIPGFQNWNARRPIDVVRLRVIIDDALKQTGITNPFNYAIFSHDNIIQSDLNDAARHHWYKAKLFTDDIFSRDLYLGICFPGTYIYLSHNSFIKVLSIISALLLCVTICLSFVYLIRQKKSSALKTDFINHMTHEFKTPITTIGLAVDSILSKEVIPDKDRVYYYSRMIKEENRRINEQVERLLQAARLDRKELYFRLQDTNVHDLINKAIDGISIQIEKRGGRIDKKLDATNPIIPTDPAHFTNLVNNLLDNANKYSPNAPEILVSTTNDQKGVYISVEDKGIGISKRSQSKIFNKFYRLSSDDITSIKGFGLGLSYIKAILKLNKGKIKVQSESGKGSRFVVFLPYSNRGH
jgi:two-component system, OmpR family, phosphate regulon sensor histidine kinase PhoR